MFIKFIRQKKSEYKIHDFVRTSDLRKKFSIGDTFNWSQKLYILTEIFDDTIPKYRIDDVSESYVEALLKKTKLTRKENDSVMKKLNITQTKSNCF